MGKIRKTISKIIPKEIKPVLPYAALMIPGLQGAGGLFANMGITNALAQKAIISGLTRGITDDKAKFGDVARAGALAIAPDIIQSGLGSLGNYLAPPGTGFSNIPGIDDLTQVGASRLGTLPQQIGQLATKAAESQTLQGFVNPGTLMETAKAVAVPSGVEYGVNAVDAAKKAQEEYQRELQAMGNLAGANKEDQMNYIRRAMVSAGFNEDEISSAISRSGFVYGGRVGYGLGSFVKGNVVKPAMQNLKKMKNKVVDFISRMTDDIEIRTQTDYADDSGASFDIYITPKTERGKNTLDQISQMGLAEKQSDGIYFINDINLEEATMSLNERGVKASGVYEPSMKGGDQFESFRTAGQGPYGADYYGYDRLKEGFQSPKRPPMDEVDYDTIPSPTDKPEGFADGGLMALRMGGMPAEMDLRKGGFVPLGKKERADDVPARLSKNEFVFTAKAVRTAGGGDIRKGAKRMYQIMNQLEARA
jgi:hypothetical protein